MLEYRRKSRAHLVEVEGDVALFYHLGQKFFVEAPGLSKTLPPLWSALCAGLDLEKARQQLSGDAIENLQLMLQNLHELQLIERPEISGSRVSLPQDANFKADPLKDLAAMIDWQDGRSTGARRQSNAWGKAFDVLTTPLVIADLGIGLAMVELQQALMLGGFESVEVRDLQSLDGLAEGTWVVAWARWGKIQKLRSLNELLYQQKRPWLLVMEDDFGGNVGPAMGGPGTPCFECYRVRRESQLCDQEISRKIDAYSEHSGDVIGFESTAFRRRLAEVVSFEMQKILSQTVFAKIRRGVFEFDLLNHNSSFQEILPLPFCPVCSKASQHPPVVRGEV
jgi:bacteriocin biosynthesis cyclodehydratase domain-containing protein